MTKLTDSVFAVKIPEDIDNLIIQDGWLVDNWADEEYIPIVKLPPGSYTLLFCSKDANVIDWAKVCAYKQCEDENDILLLWYDYVLCDYLLPTSELSGKSLLQSKSLSGNHAILFNKV